MLKTNVADPASHYFFPHFLRKIRSKRAVDSMAYFVAIAGNIAVIPQIIKAWQSNAPGLAVLTWLLFVAIGLIWLAYAIQNKQKPLIVAQIISIMCNVLVVLGWMFNN